MKPLGRPKIPFWKRVNKGAANGCWEWTGAVTSAGYGAYWYGNTSVTAHRYSAFLAGLVNDPTGKIPADDPTHVLHKCDNRKCVNPDHFFLGTMQDNSADCVRKQRTNKPKGEKHTNAKLTSVQAEEIRGKYASIPKPKQVDLASEYKVSQRVISLIVRSESYK